LKCVSRYEVEGRAVVYLLRLGGITALLMRITLRRALLVVALLLALVVIVTFVGHCSGLFFDRAAKKYRI
jgi:hypothetical protein